VSGDIDREALLPVVVLLRKEYAEDFTERVDQDRRVNFHQMMLAPA